MWQKLNGGKQWEKHKLTQIFDFFIVHGKVLIADRANIILNYLKLLLMNLNSFDKVIYVFLDCKCGTDLKQIIIIQFPWLLELVFFLVIPENRRIQVKINYLILDDIDSWKTNSYFSYMPNI